MKKYANIPPGSRALVAAEMLVETPSRAIQTNAWPSTIKASKAMMILLDVHADAVPADFWAEFAFSVRGS